MYYKPTKGEKITVGNIKKMEQKFNDLKEQRKQVAEELVLNQAAKEEADKVYYKIRTEKQNQVRELDKKISEIEAVTKLITMSYKDNIFTYNGETHIIKRERIESIKKYHSSITIDYKPVGTSRVNSIHINTGTDEQTDIAYNTIRKTLLGV